MRNEEDLLYFSILEIPHLLHLSRKEVTEVSKGKGC